MASFVNATDAIAAAVEIERRGYAFYERVRDAATHKTDKDFFNFLASEERRHEGVFSAMLERVGGLELPAGSSDGEYLAYVRGLLDSNVLFTPELAENALQSPLQQAIQFEKDTLIFFMELEQMVPDSERKYIRACANEERKHLRLLFERF